MRVYWVTVESRSFSADWSDNVIVVASDAATAGQLAVRSLRNWFPLRDDVCATDTYPLSLDTPRVVGLLTNEED